MTGNSAQMKPHEARKLLNLTGNSSLGKTEVEAAYKSAVSFWSRKIIDPLIKHDERDRAHDMLKLLMQARDTLLASSASSPVAPTGMPASGNARHTQSHPQFCGPSGAATRKAAGHMGSAFCNAFNFFREMFQFICALPAMFIEIKDFIADVMNHLETVGIPKVAVVLALILGLLPVVQVCVQMSHKFAEWFNK